MRMMNPRRATTKLCSDFFFLQNTSLSRVRNPLWILAIFSQQALIFSGWITSGIWLAFSTDSSTMALKLHVQFLYWNTLHHLGSKKSEQEKSVLQLTHGCQKATQEWDFQYCAAMSSINLIKIKLCKETACIFLIYFAFQSLLVFKISACGQCMETFRKMSIQSCWSCYNVSELPSWSPGLPILIPCYNPPVWARPAQDRFSAFEYKQDVSIHSETAEILKIETNGNIKVY